jgi:hypothetical protein
MSEAVNTDNANNADNKTGTEKPGDKPGTGTSAGGAAATADKTFTEAELTAAVQRALKDEREKAKKEAKDATLSEQEKLRERAEAAEATARTLRAKDALIEAATAAKAKSPAKIHRLYQGDLLFDDKGQPSNIAALIAQAKKDFPDEFGTSTTRGSANGGAGGDSHVGGSINDQIRRKAGY